MLDFYMLVSFFMLAVPSTPVYNGFWYVVSALCDVTRLDIQHIGLVLQMVLSCCFAENIEIFQGTVLRSVHLQVRTRPEKSSTA